MFEKAARAKLRFPYKGSITVEDLWDLSVTELDGIFKTLNRQVKAIKEESLLDKRTIADETLELQINIVKHIVAVKQTENEVRQAAREKAVRKEKLLEILARKKDGELEGKSIAELEAELASL
jgi:hypothetical protein